MPIMCLVSLLPRAATGEEDAPETSADQQQAGRFRIRCQRTRGRSCPGDAATGRSIRRRISSGIVMSVRRGLALCRRILMVVRFVRPYRSHRRSWSRRSAMISRAATR